MIKKLFEINSQKLLPNILDCFNQLFMSTIGEIRQNKRQASIRATTHVLILMSYTGCA